MATTQIETKLAQEISNEVPDVLDKILSKCEERNGNVFKISEYASKPKNNRWTKSVLATAAMFVLLVGGFFGIGQYQTAQAVTSIITLDVNPSVELKVNEDEVVLSAKGLNEDGKHIIDKMENNGEELKGKELETAVDELVSSMIEEGYLSELKNSILISVNNSDEDKSGDIKTRLISSVSDFLNENGIDGAVLGKSGAADKKIAELAEKYGISTGKANLIESIIAKNSELTFEDLSKLNINDLSLLAEEWIGEMGGFSITGSPSDKKYVGSESAIDSACAQANITVGDNAQIDSSLGLEDGKLVYKVYVKIGDTVVEYYIDAESGSIISSGSVTSGSGSTSGSQGNSGSTNGGQDNSSIIPPVTETDAPQIPTEDIVDGVVDVITQITEKNKPN